MSLNLPNFTVLPRENPKWDPALIVLPVFRDGASQLKFSNFKTSGLRLWWIGMSPASFFSFKNFLLCCYSLIPSLQVMIGLWISIQMPNYKNKVYWKLFNSFVQSPRLTPLSLVSPAKRGVSRVPLQSLLRTLPSLKRKSQNFSFPKHSLLCAFILTYNLVSSFTNFASYLYTVHPAILLIISVKQQDRTLILWPTHLIWYLCQRRPGTEDQSFLKKSLIQ